MTEYALRDHGHMVTSSKTSVTEIAITEEISILTSICHGKDLGCWKEGNGGCEDACCTIELASQYTLRCTAWSKFTRKIDVVHRA